MTYSTTLPAVGCNDSTRYYAKARKKYEIVGLRADLELYETWTNPWTNPRPIEMLGSTRILNKSCEHYGSCMYIGFDTKVEAQQEASRIAQLISQLKMRKNFKEIGSLYFYTTNLYVEKMEVLR